jgi:hypothetical protein
MKHLVASALAAAGALCSMFSALGFAADPWPGQYTGYADSYRWQATITNRAAGVYNLHVSVTSRMPECLGEVSEPAKLVGDRLLVDSDDCTLTVSRRGADGIRIEEKQCSSAHGIACPFSSELTRNPDQPDSGEATGVSPPGGAVPAATYVGRWSETPYTCRRDDTISLTRHEMHLLENGLCRFDKMTGGSGHWHTTMTCEGEGSTDTVSADLVVEGDFLSIVYGKPYNTTAKFKRCGAG